jgi:hypothetical protein
LIFTDAIALPEPGSWRKRNFAASSVFQSIVAGSISLPSGPRMRMWFSARYCGFLRISGMMSLRTIDSGAFQ